MRQEVSDEESTDVYALKVVAWTDGMFTFQIVVDEDMGQTIHPEMQLTDQLISAALGPDAKGKGLHWGVYLKAGNVLDIRLDLSQADKRKVVTWSIEDKPSFT